MSRCSGRRRSEAVGKKGKEWRRRSPEEEGKLISFENSSQEFLCTTSSLS